MAVPFCIFDCCDDFSFNNLFWEFSLKHFASDMLSEQRLSKVTSGLLIIVVGMHYRKPLLHTIFFYAYILHCISPRSYSLAYIDNACIKTNQLLCKLLCLHSFTTGVNATSHAFKTVTNAHDVKQPILVVQLRYKEMASGFTVKRQDTCVIIHATGSVVAVASLNHLFLCPLSALLRPLFTSLRLRILDNNFFVPQDHIQDDVTGIMPMTEDC